MSVYVDQVFQLSSLNPQAFLVGTRTGHKWCHMFADTEEELHVLAGQIGLRRSWFQSNSRTPHYDLVPSKRAAAIAAGAIEIDAREWFRRQQFWKEYIG